MKLKNNRGFTFIELIVVVVIISIIAGLATGSFNQYRKSGRARAAEKIISCVDYARAVAQTSNYETSIKFYYTDDNLMVDVFTNKTEYEHDIKEQYKICGSEYTLYYKENSLDSYKSLGKSEELQIDFNKSTSGFKAAGFVQNLIIDNDDASELVLVKETGRAFKVNGV